MANPKNEAKIKFSAQTEEFDASIKKANQEMSELRAELKLNETQMKRNGESVELLKTRQEVLANELNAAESKTASLNSKLQTAIEIYGKDSDAVAKLRVQVLNAQNAEEKIRTEIDKVNKSLAEQKKQADEAGEETQSLYKKVEQQEKALRELKDAYVDSVTATGKQSKESQELARKIEKLSGELKDNRQELDKAEESANKLDKSFRNSGKGAKKASDGGFSIAKSVVADLASKALQFCIDKLVEFTGWLTGLPEATREARQDMATLETSFEAMNFTTEQASKTWLDLYAVFGEDDRAVETANHIAKMSNNQEDLNKWVTITTGVWGTYQDSLPVEGLAEASNETAKVGKVTGVLADALNWSSDAAKMFAGYMGGDVVTAEDAFNKALSECSTEQERQQLITETLNTLYGDAAEKYRDASGAQMKAKEAAGQTIQTENELAEALEPVTTEYENLKNELLQGFKPAIVEVSGLATDILQWANEHPKIIQVLAIAVGVFAGALSLLAIGLGIATVAQIAMNSAIWACPVTWIVAAVIAGIAAIIAAIAAIVIYWDEITAWLKENWQNLLLFITNPVAGVFALLYDNCEGFRNIVDTVTSAGKNFFAELWKKICSIFSNVKSWFSEKFTAAKDSIVNAFSNIKEKICGPFEKARDKVKDIADKIKGFFKGEISLPKIKVPHFSIKPAGWKIGDLLQGSIPKLGIQWYAKGGILTRPTIFGMNGNNAMVGGEAGHEAILPIDRLEGYVENAIARTIPVTDFSSLEEKIDKLASRPIQMNVNGKNYATAIAGDTDNVNGQRTMLLERGLILT